MVLESIVEKLITPKIEELAKWCKDIYNEGIPRAEHFQEYLERTYNTYSIINTLVFHNSQRRLKSIYVAQTIVNEYSREKQYKYVKIDRFPVGLIKHYKKILITDTAGMGKSTIMKRMFIDLIDRGMENIGIPIYIELNRLKRDHTILMEIQEELSSLYKEFDQDLCLKLIQIGGFVFFFDGYDEISLADKREVTRDIQAFISKASTDNYFFLTSRPESGLSSFGDFQSYKIQPLKEKEAFELLKKYDISKKKVLFRKLVELLESGKYDSVREFLENPLLVSLLFTAYDYNRSIPLEKHRFYGIVYEAFFEKHDNTKSLYKREKYSGLNYEDFDRVLRYVGYDCLIKIGVKFNKDNFFKTIGKAKVFCGLPNLSENNFLEDLVTTVPLLCRDGNDYKWVHKSLLEFFAARFIFCDAKEKQNEILTAIYNSKDLSKYLNMLDLYYDIDLTGFSKNITLPFCEDFIKFYDESLVASKINKDLIERRISCLFYYEMALMVSSDDQLSIENACNLLGNWVFGEKKSYQQIGEQVIHFVFRRGLCQNRRMYLTQLLFSKKSSITITKSGIVSEDEVNNQLKECGLPKGISQFKHFIVYELDSLTGDQSEELYKLINILLNYYCDTFLIDYGDCKKEVEKILAQSVDGLLVGI